ncbi:MAG: hypothetical protein ACE5HE_01335 [Phycisphaerae bacterium]
MAKQLVGPVERHLEKAVVGMAGLVLMGVVARYAVTSPNFLELAGERVTPATIDAKVAVKAADIRRRIQKHEVEVETPEPLYPQFLQELDTFASNSLALEYLRAVPFGPPVPIIDPPEVIKGRKKLVEIVALSKPRVTHGRSTFDFSHTGGTLQVRNWATVSAVFNRKEQLRILKQQYGAKHDTVVFGGVELDRRERRPDGSWSDEDWQTVEVFPKPAIPAVPVVDLVLEDNQVVVPRDSYLTVRGFVDELSVATMQVNVLRPLMPEVRNGDRWEFPMIASYKDVLDMDAEYLDPERDETSPIDRYMLQTEQEASETPEKELTPREIIEQLFDTALRKLQNAKQNMSLDDAYGAYNSAADVVLNRDATGTDKAKAQRIMDEASQAIRDIQRRGRDTRPGHGPGAGERKRELLPTQQVWAHDAGPGSIESGKTYQYRIRMVLFNSLAADPAQFEDKTNAGRVLIAGPWSEPSDPVTIEPDTQYFATAFDERNEEVRMELFRWFDGVWVTHRWDFKIGGAVEGEAREPVPISDSDEVDRPMIRFAPNVEVVDIDFKRPYRDHRPKRGGIAVADTLISACSVVLVDAEGKLTERFILDDKASPVRRSLSKVVFQPPRRH